MARWDIESESLFWSFGIFALVFIGLIIVFTLYGLVSLLRRKVKEMKEVEEYIERKLFFSSILRYMIESYLKITHNSIFFLYLNGRLDSEDNRIQLGVNIAIIAIFVLWPFLIYVFLMSFRTRLEEKTFKNRFHSTYLGNKTDDYLGDTL